MKDFKVHTIIATSTVRDALRKLNTLPEMCSRTLFVIDDGSLKLIGAVTDGDIRRGLLKNLDLMDSITLCMSVNYRYLIDTEEKFTKIKSFRSDDIGMIPIINKSGIIIDIIDLSDLTTILPLTAIIMAGGRGERLRPLTATTPKPMLKIEGIPIIEYGINRLKKFGINEIYISVNYLGQQICDYFDNGESWGVNIKYIWENEPLGTLGALSLLPEVEHEHLLVLNSDILTDINFQDFFECYINAESSMCVVSIPYHVQVPYAVLQVENENIISFKEKPSYNFHSNGGMYLIRKQLKALLPLGKHYNTTDLMDSIISRQEKITHYPHVGYWLDIGQHADFKKAQEDIKRIKF